MDCDLEALFEEIAPVLPALKPGHEKFLFSSETLPVPPSELETSSIIIKKALHEYTVGFANNFSSTTRIDLLLIQASKSTCRNLGLLILAGLFHPSPTDIHVKLLHPASQIKNLLILTNYIDVEDIWHYATKPLAYGYSPSDTDRHPWYDKVKDPDDLPIFCLANWKSLTFSEEDWRNRDTVIGFGNDRASVRFAELLLNASMPQNPVVEYQLEGERGFRGVGVESAEVQLFLPGSLGWLDILDS